MENAFRTVFHASNKSKPTSFSDNPKVLAVSADNAEKSRGWEVDGMTYGPSRHGHKQSEYGDRSRSDRVRNNRAYLPSLSDFFLFCFVN